MKLPRLITALLLAVALPLASAGPLTVANGKFMKDGKPFYGVGVNYFDGFTRFLASNDTSYKVGLATLAANKVPYIRMNTFGYWPDEVTKRYLANKQIFYYRLDQFMNEAATRKVGVILNLFWNYTVLVDISKETMPAWAVQSSETRKLMRTITAEIATRYKNHPALWGWEYSNEANSFMDLPNYSNNYQYLPPKVPGTVSTRTTSDNFNPAVILAGLADFAKTIRIIDPVVPIFSGHNITRATAYHLQTNNWTQDTPAQFGEMLSRDNVMDTSGVPPDVNTLTMHIYANSEGTFFNDPNSKFADIVAAAMSRSATDGRPFFLGEFGTDSALMGADPAKVKFYEMTDAIIANRVQMSTLWVYDFKYLEGSYNVTSTNARAYQLEKLKQMNTLMATW
ncbi:cellulase family glycosylhydrolase [Oxalobacteraceae bacterium]|nr:cellulase family glycosylhydrolase [Oxalobacteraceae bacterium]